MLAKLMVIVTRLPFFHVRCMSSNNSLLAISNTIFCVNAWRDRIRSFVICMTILKDLCIVINIIPERNVFVLMLYSVLLFDY